MPSSVRTTRDDLQTILVIAAAYMQSLALTQPAIRNLTLELDQAEAQLDLDDLEADEDLLGNQTPDFQRMSAGLVAIAATLSGPGSRGPYDQIDKCTTWFTIALGWPDRDFHHTFRVGRKTFDRLVSLLEPNLIFASKGRKPQRQCGFSLQAF
ncbi:hypothetical protein BU15DRAFT_83225 [Melanogaster broomeanus]|nr:hypothetical protein BU15DRAFT_83225 [Melanogaster broomeanus]